MAFPIHDLRVYGDGAIRLGGRAQADAQSIFAQRPESVTVIGDVDELVDRARGGGDVLVQSSLQSVSLVGDALSMADRAVGGDDALVANAPARTAAATGDGVTMTGHAVGGDDAVTVGSGRIGLALGDAELLADHARGRRRLRLVAGRRGPRLRRRARAPRPGGRRR